MSDTLNLANSIWPNGMKVDSDGYAVFYPLGTNKIEVPTSSSAWPKGNKLISPFVYDENNKLVGFCDTKAMTVSGQTSITLNYEHIEADFSSIEEGMLTINAPNATYEKYIWGITQNDDSVSYDYVIIDFNTTDQETINTVRSTYRVVDKKMYDVDGNVIGTIDTSKIEVGGFYGEETDTLDGIFCNIDAVAMEERGLILSEFDSDLSSLRDGSAMFTFCSQLTSFNIDLPSLTDGSYMFYYSALESFSSDLSSLTNGSAMFGVSALSSFTSNLPILTNGATMFAFCSNLTSFNSDLPSLTDGYYMFHTCKLDASSVKNIIDTINTYTGELTLGIGCNNTTEDKDLFAQEVGYADMTALLAALKAKGWTVSAQYNGRPASTYDLRRPSEDTLPVFVKLEEVEDHAAYTSLDDSKKFRLNYFHETTGSTDGYTQFNSLEEAIETLNIKPIERN